MNAALRCLGQVAASARASPPRPRIRSLLPPSARVRSDEGPHSPPPAIGAYRYSEGLTCSLCRTLLFRGSAGSSVRSLRRTSSTPPTLAPTRRFHTVPEQPWLALDRLTVNPGAHKRKRLLGRGFANGRKCGRGAGGYKSYSGNSIHPRQEGGTPLYLRLPKIRKRKDGSKRRFVPFNLDKLQWAIDSGRVNPHETITMKSLKAAGLLDINFERYPHGIKLCGKGKEHFNACVSIDVPMASHDAAKAVLENNGTLRLVYHTPLGVRVQLKPNKWLRRNLPLPRHAEPPPRWAFFYTERDAEGLPYKPVSHAEDVLYVHPGRALYRGLFNRPVAARLRGETSEQEQRFNARVAELEAEQLRAQQQAPTSPAKEKGDASPPPAA